MKCEICHTRMESLLIEGNIESDGITKHIINIPAHRCEVCKKIVVKDYVKDQIAAFMKKSTAYEIDFKAMQEENNTAKTPDIDTIIF